MVPKIQFCQVENKDFTLFILERVPDILLLYKEAKGLTYIGIFNSTRQEGIKFLLSPTETRGRPAELILRFQSCQCPH